jgi:hypothetical protein
MPYRFLSDPEGQIGDQVVHWLGEGEQVAHREAAATIDNVTTIGVQAALPTHTHDGSDATAGVEDPTLEVFGI